MSNLENHNPQVIRQISKEVKNLTTEQLEGIRISVNESNLTDIQATIDGPGSYPINLQNKTLRFMSVWEKRAKFPHTSHATLTQFPHYALSSHHFRPPCLYSYF